MSASTSQPSERDWLAHKDLIRYEYLVKETSLEDLAILLKARGLHASKGQLECKLRNWNFSKNIDKETWQYIGRKIRKRKDEGKDSDVIHCGKRLKKVKVTKETNRHRETNIMARLKTPPPSPANPQLSICTPPTFQMSFEWPSSLPWLRLRETSWNIIINASSSNVLVAYQRDQANIAPSLIIRALFPQSGLRPSISLSSLITGVSNVMPEWYPGEHTRTAQNLLAGPTAESVSEYFKVMVYMLSNSMVTRDHSQLDFYTILMRIGFIDLRADLKKLRNESSTFRAFMERLFQSEIGKATGRSQHITDTERPKPLHLIKWLLELGQDPNCHSTYAGYPELVELLLRFGARDQVPQKGPHNHAFVNLALGSGCSDVGKSRVLNLLFDHKFLSMDDMLRAAIELRDEALTCKMLQYGADVTGYGNSWLKPARQLGFRPSHFASPSALMMAVQAGGRMADLMLDYILIKGQPVPSILADACIAAAFGGHYDIVLRLHEMNNFATICNAEGITPLQAAVVGGNAAVCKYLLERHGGSPTSLIPLAVVLGNVEIVDLLIDYGADPNARPYTDHDRLYDYFSIPAHCFSGSPSTILTMLLRQAADIDGMEKIFLKLIRNGAVLSYGDVVRLSNPPFYRCLAEALSAGGDPNDVDRHGRTALHHAISNLYLFDEEEETDRCVISDEEYQIDGCLSFYYEGETAIQLLDSDISRFQQPRLIVKLLIQSGARMTGGEVVKVIIARDTPLLLFLLQHGGTLTDIDDTGRGCLEAEIEARTDPSLQEALEMQQFAIDAGPFCAAIQQQDWALVERLFERAHKVATCHRLEGTAVGLAAEVGQLTVIEKLLTRFTHHSVLSSAILPIDCSRGNIRGYNNDGCREGFWRTAPDEDEDDCIEGSLLSLAALGQDTSGFKELLRRGCGMDTIAWSIVGGSEKSSDYLNLLREFGTGLGTATKHDLDLRTALCESIYRGNHDVTQYLVEVGADVDEIDKYDRLSPLQLAAKEGDIDIALYLLGEGANVNAPPAFCRGATALQFAALGGYIGFARHLLELGARINARGSPIGGRSALEGAAEHGRLDMMALLVHHGAVTTGRGRQQLINSVAFAQERAHITAAEWLKETCGWTDADQNLLETVDSNSAAYHLEECLRWYCCDEYHDSDTECVYHYTEEQRWHHYRDCEKCLEFEAEAGKGRDIDDENDVCFSGEDEVTVSEGDEDCL
ncbi:hypothetical protein FGADI_7552 [Fusarium gaditjirri]|uniref:Clr5 domain-containing protein n=1 Tax=Fusarium gaditjirri TaxID=282569 RepID=A0A8H4T501_9HYPO|nr:hypothetical protein FGADI_7552 [Fusarium gaditjirri]